MFRQFVIACLTASLAGCSIIPRTEPSQAVAPAPASAPAGGATEQKPDESRTPENGVPDSGSGKTARAHDIVKAVLYVLLIAVLYAATKGMADSVAKSCCYR